jgi:DNA-binding NarL/FixJ family response regulator
MVLAVNLRIEASLGGSHRGSRVDDVLRIAIIDNYSDDRAKIVQILSRDKNVVVVAEGQTLKEAKQFANRLKVDVLLLEAAVPGSLRAMKSILRAHQAMKIVFMTSTADEEYAAEALRAGAHGYIIKDITGPDLIAAIKAIHGGERYVTPCLAWQLLTAQPKFVRKRPASGEPLSMREQQVLDHASRGLTNKEIASTLGLTVGTIKSYKARAFGKVGARNRLEAIFAIEQTSKQA